MHAFVIKYNFNNDTIIQFHEQFQNKLSILAPLLQSCVEYVSNEVGDKKNQIVQIHLNFKKDEAKLMKQFGSKIISSLQKWICTQDELIYGDHRRFRRNVTKAQKQPPNNPICQTVSDTPKHQSIAIKPQTPKILNTVYGTSLQLNNGNDQQLPMHILLPDKDDNMAGAFVPTNVIDLTKETQNQPSTAQSRQPTRLVKPSVTNVTNASPKKTINSQQSSTSKNTQKQNHSHNHTTRTVNKNPNTKPTQSKQSLSTTKKKKINHHNIRIPSKKWQCPHCKKYFFTKCEYEKHRYDGLVAQCLLITSDDDKSDENGNNTQSPLYSDYLYEEDEDNVLYIDNSNPKEKPQQVQIFYLHSGQKIYDFANDQYHLDLIEKTMHLSFDKEASNSVHNLTRGKLEGLMLVSGPEKFNPKEKYDDDWICGSYLYNIHDVVKLPNNLGDKIQIGGQMGCYNIDHDVEDLILNVECVQKKINEWCSNVNQYQFSLS